MDKRMLGAFCEAEDVARLKFVCCQAGATLSIGVLSYFVFS